VKLNINNPATMTFLVIGIFAATFAMITTILIIPYSVVVALFTAFFTTIMPLGLAISLSAFIVYLIFTGFVALIFFCLIKKRGLI
jgi:hypothetical protein